MSIKQKRYFNKNRLYLGLVLIASAYLAPYGIMLLIPDDGGQLASLGKAMIGGLFIFFLGLPLAAAGLYYIIRALIPKKKMCLKCGVMAIENERICPHCGADFDTQGAR